MKNTLGLLLVAVVFSMMFVGLVCASATVIPQVSPSPTVSVYPSVSPTPTLNPNATVTATSSPTPAPTAIYVDLDNVQSINPNGAPLTFSPYNQTIVNLVYAECMNSSLDVSAYSSNWYETRNPNGITFFANDVGSFMLHYRVLYSQVVNQSITLSVKSGDGTVTTLPIASVNSGFTLDVTIYTLVQPHYPTAEEQAAANNQQNKALLGQTISYFDSQQAWMKTAIIGAVAGIIVVVIILILVLRHQRHTDYEINNQNAHGWGRGRM